MQLGFEDEMMIMPLPYAAMLISIIIMISITVFILMRKYHD